MPDYLQKIVYLTKEQYNQLITSQNQTITVGSTTHQYNANNLYFTTDDNIAVTDLEDNFILPVTKGGTGKNQFTTGSLLVGQGAGATQFGEISATNSNTANTVVKRDGNCDFSAGTITATLNGNANTSTKTGNSSIWLYTENNNEINFGGTNNSATIYFGYRAKDSKAIPTKFIFGNSTGTADLQVKTVYLGSGTSSYISSTNYTGTAAKATNDVDNNAIKTTYLKRGGGQMTGSLTWKDSTALPEAASADYFLTIDAFANGGATKWIGKANALKSLIGTTQIGETTTPIYWTGSAFSTGTALKNLAYIDKPSSNQTTTYLRGDGNWVSLSDMGLSNALHFIGITTTDMTANDASNHLYTGVPEGITNYTTPTQGDVVINNTKNDEWVCTVADGANSKWERLGSDTSYKIVQSAVSSATAETTKATTFVHSVTQDTNGVITVKTRPLDTSGDWEGTAASLKNTKTIWGQNFNGTQNVTGSMTNVGPNMKLPENQTEFDFYTSSSGAANAKFGKLGLNSAYANIDISNYTLDVGGKTRISDYIYRVYSASGSSPVIWMNGADYDNWLWKISSGTTNDMYFGYGLKYIGIGSGVANYLRLYADNQNGTEVIAIGINQSGQIGIGTDASTNYRLNVSGTSYFSNQVIISGNSASAPLVLKSGTSSYREGLRIIPSGSWADIVLGGNDITEASGISTNSWFIGNNNGNFYITRNGSSSSSSAILSCVSNVWSWNGTATGNIDGNATTATSWQNARQVYVALGTTSTGTSLNGTASTNVAALGIGVNGTLGVGNGGTGVTSSNDIFATYGVEYIEGTQTKTTNEWTGNTNSASLYVGKVIAYKLPWPGNTSNATLNLTLSGGTKTGAKNVYAGNTQLKTHYPANSIMIMVWNGTEWRTNPYYFENENSKLRTYASLTNLDVPLLAGNASASITATWTDYTAGSQYLYGAIPNDKTKHATINLSTGHVTIPGGITGDLTGNADTATTAGSVAWANTGHPDTFPPSSHTHGNITNSGCITTAITLAANDYIIIGDNSASGKLGKGPVFDASDETKVLSKKGTWVDVNKVKTTATTDNTPYKLLMSAGGGTTISSGSNYEVVYDTNVTLNPSNQMLAGLKTIKYNDRLYPFVKAQTRSKWYKITFPYSNATTDSSGAKSFMSSFDIHIGGSYSNNPSGVIHVSNYWTRAANNGAWQANQCSAKIDGILMNKVTLYYRIAEPGVLYINNNSNQYNGIWIDNLFVDDAAATVLDWSTTTIETCSEITSSTNPALSAYTVVPTVSTYSDNSNLYINGMLSVANTGNTAAGPASEAAMQIREYNYSGAGGDAYNTWGYAPRLAWNWSGRSKTAQIGLGSNGYLYTAPNNSSTFYKIMYESGTWNINVGGTATGISTTGGTTANFWRGDNSWSNTLSGDLLIGNVTAYNSNAQGSFIGTKAISCCFSNTEDLSTAGTGYYLYGNGSMYAALRIIQIGTTTQKGICRLTLGTSAGTGIDGNASGEITLYNNTASNSYAALSTQYNLIGTSMPATRIYSANGFVMPENKIGILFKTNSDSYYTSISYQTGGNQALVFGTKNSVTSFIFINGEDPVNISSTRWQSLTPALQIKDNSVYIGELIANGSTPGYKFKVTGASYFNGETTMNGHLAFTHTSGSAPGYITWRSGDYRQRIQIDDNSTTNDAVFTFKQSEDSGTTYKNLLTIRDNGSIIIGMQTVTTQPTGTNTSGVNRITITPPYYTGPWYITARDDATYANLILKFGDGELMKVRRDGAVTIGNIRICTGNDSGPSRTISTVGDTNLLILSPYQKGVVFRQNDESGASVNKIWIVGDQLYPEANNSGLLGTAAHRWKELYIEAQDDGRQNGIRFYTGTGTCTGSIGANKTGGVGIYSTGALYFRTALNNANAGMQMDSTKLYPSSNDALDLGSSTREWVGTYSKKFIVEQHVTMQWNSTDQSLDFIFA